ncbi:MAG TPA: VOC family protein [Propionibacteriaceae bacterium]|nr:VOC family protein [Propionibacteriaceae bacterium]
MTSDREAQVAIKDLCLDAADPAAAATFWSAVLNLTPAARGDEFVLSDHVDEHTLWVNQVPETRVVKQRVHLDIATRSVADLTAIGARVLDDQQFSWTVMTDPEGGEFCAFVRDPDALPQYRLYEVVVDAEDPERITAWWGDRLGLQPQRGDEGSFWYLESPDLPWSLTFVAVPEPKTVKNRVHWDVWGVTEELLAVGATLLRARDDEIRWDVLADPEGNEFDVFAREPR